MPSDPHAREQAPEPIAAPPGINRNSKKHVRIF